MIQLYSYEVLFFFPFKYHVLKIPIIDKINAIIFYIVFEHIDYFHGEV